jgi:hypothetical protein
MPIGVAPRSLLTAGREPSAKTWDTRSSLRVASVPLGVEHDDFRRFVGREVRLPTLGLVRLPWPAALWAPPDWFHLLGAHAPIAITGNRRSSLLARELGGSSSPAREDGRQSL